MSAGPVTRRYGERVPDDGGAGPVLNAVWLGRMAFDAALELQLAAREALAAGTGPEILYLVEHPPTLTVGRRGRREDILWTDAQLQAAGVVVCDTPRGGEVTLHAPGQLVAYPVIQIGRKIRQHLIDLGEASIALLAAYGVLGTSFRMDQPGVWLGTTKLASVGVHISRGITVQGVAVNLDVPPGLFGALISCGLHGVQMVSATTVGGTPEPLPRAARRWAELFARATGRSLALDGSFGPADDAAGR